MVGVGVRRGTAHLLTGVDWQVELDERWVILGANGAGKTTLLRLLAERIAEAAAGPGGQDYKTRLQELATRAFDELPRYEIEEEGPDHAKRFFAVVYVADQPRGRGEGRSKKQAEQAAARVAWLELQSQVELAQDVS